jgi:MFS family permease
MDDFSREALGGMNGKLSAQERRAVLLLGTAHALTHAMMLTFPAILIPLMKEFDLNLFGVGLLGNVGYFLFGAGALPAGILADRWGPKCVLTLFFSGSFLACLTIFFSRGIAAMAFGLILSGASASLYHPSGLSYLTQKVRLRGKALGYHGMAGNVGLAAAPSLAALCAVQLGWRFVYLVLAVLFGTMAFLNWRSRFWDEVTLQENLGDTEKNVPPDRTEKWPLVVLYGILVLAGFIYRGALTYLPTYLSSPSATGRGWNLSVTGAGAVTTAALILGIFAQWLGGNLSQRYRLEPLCFGLILLALPFLSFMAFSGGVTLAVMTALFVFFYFCWQPVSNGLVARYTHRSFRSIGFGLSFTLSFGAGSFASSIAGKIGDVFGLDRIYLFLSILLLSILVLSAILVLLARGRQAVGEPGAYSYG